MGLEDLTREAVIQAMDEYDGKGKKNFLAEYGFSKPRLFWIEYRGKIYPSKAIAGAAHRFLPPFYEPLRSSDFVDGLDGAAKVMQKLGFTLVKR